MATGAFEDDSKTIFGGKKYDWNFVAIFFSPDDSIAEGGDDEERLGEQFSDRLGLLVEEAPEKHISRIS